MDREFDSFDDADEGVGFDDYETLIEDLDDTEDAELALEFAGDEGELPWSECVLRAEDTLGEFSFGELLKINDMDETEALALLFEAGHIGLPVEVDEEVQDIPPEEIED